MAKERILIVGGDAAGMSAAGQIRKLLPDSEIVVYERSGYSSYSACGIPYFIAGLVEGGMSPLAAYQRLRAVHAHIQGHNAPGGGANNLVILNYDSPTPLTQDNFPGHFCYAFDARNVESVISQGRLIVDHGRLTGMDEADILAYANEQARRLWALL